MFSEVTEWLALYGIFVYQLPRNNDVALSLEKIYLPRRPVVFALKLYEVRITRYSATRPGGALIDSMKGGGQRPPRHRRKRA